MDRLCHSQPLLETLNALNLYQLNIYQNLNFMCRLKNNNIPKVFTDLIKKVKQKYPAKFSKNSYTTKSFSLINMKYFISIRGPKLWNDLLTSLFQKTIKSKLIEPETELCTFDNFFSNFLFLILILSILISQNFKWELRYRLDDKALLLSLSPFLVTTPKLCKHYGYMLFFSFYRIELKFIIYIYIYILFNFDKYCIFYNINMNK